MDPTQTHGAFSWMEHQGNDVDKAKEFYRRVLGWDFMDMPMEDGSKYPAITLGEKPIGGFAAKPGNHWLPYITVDDVDARTQAAQEAGGEVLCEPFDAPGVGRMAVVRDPIGASVALIRYQTA